MRIVHLLAVFAASLALLSASVAAEAEALIAPLNNHHASISDTELSSDHRRLKGKGKGGGKGGKKYSSSNGKGKGKGKRGKKADGTLPSRPEPSGERKHKKGATKAKESDSTPAGAPSAASSNEGMPTEEPLLTFFPTPTTASGSAESPSESNATESTLVVGPGNPTENTVEDEQIVDTPLTAGTPAPSLAPTKTATASPVNPPTNAPTVNPATTAPINEPTLSPTTPVPTIGRTDPATTTSEPTIATDNSIEAPTDPPTVSDVDESIANTNEPTSAVVEVIADDSTTNNREESPPTGAPRFGVVQQPTESSPTESPPTDGFVVLRPTTESDEESALENPVSTTTTLAPSFLPTSEPDSGISSPSSPLVGDNIDEIQLRAIASEAIGLETWGSTNLDESQAEVFEVFDTVLHPFLKSQLGPALSGSELSLTFVQESTAMVTHELTDDVTYRNFMQVRTYVEVIDEVITPGFDRSALTDLTTTFFSGNTLRTVIDMLRDRGFEVDRINVVDLESLFPTTADDGEDNKAGNVRDGSGKSQPNVGLIAGLVSVSLVLLVAIAAFAHQKRRRQKHFGEAVIMSDNESEGTQSNKPLTNNKRVAYVKPSALQQRRLREEKARRNHESSSESSYDKSVDQFSDYEVDLGNKDVINAGALVPVLEPTSPPSAYNISLPPVSPPDEYTMSNNVFGPSRPPAQTLPSLLLPEIPPSPVWSLDEESQGNAESLTWDERQEWKSYASEDVRLLTMSDSGHSDRQSDGSGAAQSF